MANIAKVGRCLAWTDLDRDVIERLGGGNLSVRIDVPVVWTDFGIARRKDLIGRVDGVYGIIQCDALGLKLLTVNIGHDLANFAADG